MGQFFFEFQQPLKTQNPPGFHARARPVMATPVCYWVEMMATVNIYQI
jgi:hypothetical protein